MRNLINLIVCWILVYLRSILDDGFIIIGDCIFLDKVLHWDFERNLNGIERMKTDFLDLSGIENANNKIHIDDYVSQEVFEKSFIFLYFFKTYWYKEFPNISCFISLSFQDDEIGELATFSFHKYRKK